MFLLVCLSRFATSSSRMTLAFQEFCQGEVTLCQDLSLEGPNAPETGWTAKVYKLGLQMTKTKCRP